MCLNQRSSSRLVAGLIDHYFLDAPNLIDALRSACERSDVAALAQTAHVLGVGSEFVGARKLAAMCGDLENAGLAGAKDDLERRIACIRQEYEAVHLAMEAVRTAG